VTKLIVGKQKLTAAPGGFEEERLEPARRNIVNVGQKIKLAMELLARNGGNFGPIQKFECCRGGWSKAI
jgi:hypothetical protein